MFNSAHFSFFKATNSSAYTFLVAFAISEEIFLIFNFLNSTYSKHVVGLVTDSDYTTTAHGEYDTSNQNDKQAYVYKHSFAFLGHKAKRTYCNRYFVAFSTEIDTSPTTLAKYSFTSNPFVFKHFGYFEVFNRANHRHTTAYHLTIGPRSMQTKLYHNTRYGQLTQEISLSFCYDSFIAGQN